MPRSRSKPPDERIRRLVFSRPIPERLIRDLSRAPLLESHQVRKYVSVHRNLTPTLYRTLELLCYGYSVREIAHRRHYSYTAIQDHSKRLLALFRARNRAHLAALAVASGYISLAAHSVDSK